MENMHFRQNTYIIDQHMTSMLYGTSKESTIIKLHSQFDGFTKKAKAFRVLQQIKWSKAYFIHRNTISRRLMKYEAKNKNVKHDEKQIFSVLCCSNPTSVKPLRSLEYNKI